MNAMKRLYAALIASTVAISVMQPVNAGYYFEAVTSNEVSGQAGVQISTVHSWVDGDNAKVEFQDQAQGGIFQPGSYLLTTDAGATLDLVNTEEMTITTIDFEQIMNMAGSMMEAMGGVVNMEFSDFSTERISESAGPTILGFPTTYSRYETGYTMSISVMGFTRESRVDTDNQVWCSEDFDANGLRVWVRPDRFRTGNEDFDRLIREQYQAMNCLPLRNEVVTTTSGSGGNSITTTTTEIVELREEEVSPGVYALPTNYERVSLMDGITGGQDTGAGDEDQGGMPNLRDLFRR
jgi:hypothetical protein